jgi:hypothetical protein
MEGQKILISNKKLAAYGAEGIVVEDIVSSNHVTVQLSNGKSISVPRTDLIPVFNVQLKYFVKPGVLFKEALYTTTQLQMPQLAEDLQNLRDAGNLPGVKGSEWIVKAHPLDHPKGYPILIL